MESMTSIRTLPPPEYTNDEKLLLIDFLLALKKTHLRDFFLRIPGTLDSFARVSWNGLDANGVPVASGVYFVRATQGSSFATEKVAVIR